MKFLNLLLSYGILLFSLPSPVMSSFDLISDEIFVSIISRANCLKQTSLVSKRFREISHDKIFNRRLIIRSSEKLKEVFESLDKDYGAYFCFPFLSINVLSSLLKKLAKTGLKITHE